MTYFKTLSYDLLLACSTHVPTNVLTPDPTDVPNELATSLAPMAIASKNDMTKASTTAHTTVWGSKVRQQVKIEIEGNRLFNSTLKGAGLLKYQWEDQRGVRSKAAV